MSLASVTAQQSAALAAANSAAAASANTAAAASSSSSSSSASSTATDVGNTALTALSSNFGDFLNMLMTQLQNQDPTSPMDTNQFTSELVQFSGVEQQINTNSSLTQLIQLTQGGEVMQASSMMGDRVTAQSTALPLQNGSATVNYTGTAGEPIAIAVYNSSGEQVYDTTQTATAGNNSWTWNGTDSSGDQLPDGAYSVAVETADANGNASAVPFTVTGTATSVQDQNNTMELQLGAVSVPFSAVQSVQPTASTQ